MRKAFACFVPSVRNDDDDVQEPPGVQVRPAKFQEAKDTSKGTKRCEQCPSGAAIGSAEFSETDVLHRVQGKCCDLVFMSAKLQDQSIAAWLEQQGLSLLEPGADHGESEDLLRKLLGAEQAQAAMEAVQQGVPYMTVLERKLPADEQAGLASSAPYTRSLLPAQLACPSGPFPWLSKVNHLPYLMPFSAKVMAGGPLEQSQGKGSSGTEVLREGPQLKFQVLAQHPLYASKPASAAGVSSCSSSSFFFFGSQYSSPCSGGGSMPFTGSSTQLSSNTPSTTIHTQGSSLSLGGGPFLMPTQESPNCSKASLQQGSAELPRPAPAKAKPDADLSHSLISKAQGLSNTALDRIRRPSFDQQNPGSYDRTLAMLQILQMDHSPEASNQALPSFQAMCASCAGNACPHLDSKNREARCDNLGPQNGTTSTACTQSLEAGVCIATPVPALGEPAIVASPAAAGCPPTDSSLHAECSLMYELEDIAEEMSSTSNVRRSGERQRPLQGHMSHASKRAIEISVRPIQTKPGGSKPLAMVSFADISDQMQVQGFLLSLAESQLLLLSSLLPKHAIDFLARQSSATDAIPQNMAKLARTHEAVTLLFMDICGYTTMSKSVEPQEIMAFINTLFSTLDRLTDQFSVTKVETAGDCYIVSAGVLSSNSRNGFSHTLDRHSAPEASARRVMEFAKAVLQEAAKIMMPRSTNPVQVRVGMHTGDVVSGLIGSKLPKFSIFGDTMNTAARMESTGVPGRIHVSEATQGLLPEYAWESVGLIPVKGKGKMHTYLWDSSKSWSG